MWSHLFSSPLLFLNFASKHHQYRYKTRYVLVLVPVLAVRVQPHCH
jgi:hypothetical protein